MLSLRDVIDFSHGDHGEHWEHGSGDLRDRLAALFGEAAAPMTNKDAAIAAMGCDGRRGESPRR